jgi:hypothetical protein
MTRYEPSLSDRLSLFTQVELVNTFPTEADGNHNYIQRMRMRLKMKEWQFGFRSDFNEFGINALAITTNIGALLRHEFN